MENIDKMEKQKIRKNIEYIVTAWNFNRDLSSVMRENMVAQILRNKIDTLAPSLSKITPDGLLLFCSLCSDGNSGLAMMLLKEIYMRRQKTILRNIRQNIWMPIGAGCVVAVCSDLDYPIMQDGRFRKKYERLWEGQVLSDGRNGVDTEEFWNEILRNEILSTRLDLTYVERTGK